MATIDIKLKTYEQLQFEIMKLNTDNYLKQQQLDKYKNVIDKIKELIKSSGSYKGICTQPQTDTFSYILELLEEVE